MDVLLSTSGIVIIVVMILLTFVMWKVAKLLLIPIQILLFLALMFIAYKLLFAPEQPAASSEDTSGEKVQNTLVDPKVGKKIADKIKKEAIEAGKAALDSVKSAAAQQNAPAVAGTAEADPAAEAVKR